MVKIVMDLNSKEMFLDILYFALSNLLVTKRIIKIIIINVDNDFVW